MLHDLSRRDCLRLSALGLAGAAAPSWGIAKPVEAKKKPKSVIILFLLGAPPQHETWDPKPDAPAEVRGDHSTIASATPGLRLGETMVKTAKVTNKIAVVRAFQTNDGAHSSSAYAMSTGYAHTPMQVENAKTGAPNDWPSVGAVVRKLMRNESGLPSAITLPEQAANDGNLTWPGQDAGFLGRSFDPWLLNCDPLAEKFEIPGLSLPADVPGTRFDARQNLLKGLDGHFGRFASGYSVHEHQRSNALEMIASPEARKAFDLNKEDAKLRDRYGRTRFGQSCLLARRLVEVGVPLVRVNWSRVPKMLNNGAWDTHKENSKGVKELMPILDAAYATLIEDLADRGMLDDTMVVWVGEFGRTPKINGVGGRDHWGKVGSFAMAGGGVRGGTVYGASDAIGGYPKDGLVRPQDYTATIFHTLGIPLESEFVDTLGRPLAITRGEVIRGIY